MVFLIAFLVVLVMVFANSAGVIRQEAYKGCLAALSFHDWKPEGKVVEEVDKSHGPIGYKFIYEALQHLVRERLVECREVILAGLPASEYKLTHKGLQQRIDAHTCEAEKSSSEPFRPAGW